MSTQLPLVVPTQAGEVPASRWAPPSVNTDTSRQAAAEITPHARALQVRVLACIAAQQGRGATCDEVEIEADIRQSTVSARVRELAVGGHVVDTGIRRRTRSGRKAIVWLAREWA